MDNEIIIKDAIENKKQIKFSYNWYDREACPHRLWMKDGIMECLVYQFWWNTSKWIIPLHIKPNRRRMFVSNMKNIVSMSWDWYADQLNKPYDTKWRDYIIAEVNF